jgi:hypothetical protein
VSSSELRTIMSNWGTILSKQETEEIIRFVDQNGDGEVRLSYDYVFQCLQCVNSLLSLQSRAYIAGFANSFTLAFACTCRLISTSLLACSRETLYKVEMNMATRVRYVRLKGSDTRLKGGVNFSSTKTDSRCSIVHYMLRSLFVVHLDACLRVLPRVHEQHLLDGKLRCGKIAVSGNIKQSQY